MTRASCNTKRAYFVRGPMFDSRIPSDRIDEDNRHPQRRFRLRHRKASRSGHLRGVERCSRHPTDPTAPPKLPTTAHHWNRSRLPQALRWTAFRRFAGIPAETQKSLTRIDPGAVTRLPRKGARLSGIGSPIVIPGPSAGARLVSCHARTGGNTPGAVEPHGSGRPSGAEARPLDWVICRLTTLGAKALFGRPLGIGRLLVVCSSARGRYAVGSAGPRPNGGANAMVESEARRDGRPYPTRQAEPEAWSLMSAELAAAAPVPNRGAASDEGRAATLSWSIGIRVFEGTSPGDAHSVALDRHPDRPTTRAR